MRAREAAGRPYAALSRDPVRRSFEEPLLERLLPRLLRAAGGAQVLDLGCGDGLVAALAGGRIERYLGVDLEPRAADLPCIAHDLREGLGPVGVRAFDLYLGTFGVASHLSPAQLARLLGDIARHARPGALVALEALGLNSLEWPSLWESEPGPTRLIPYRLGADVAVHPWSPAELSGLYLEAGLEPVGALDRSLQTGPKLGEGRYWPGLPPLRAALNGLLEGIADVEALGAALPPLPACEAALVHHELARRRRLLAGTSLAPAPLAEAIWRLEPVTRGGLGHGLLFVGRVR
jgi:SAM-dependent methyltransferase